MPFTPHSWIPCHCAHRITIREVRIVLATCDMAFPPMCTGDVSPIIPECRDGTRSNMEAEGEYRACSLGCLPVGVHTRSAFAMKTRGNPTRDPRTRSVCGGHRRSRYVATIQQPGHMLRARSSGKL